MKRWKLCALAVVVLAGAGLGLLYRDLEPSRHFEMKTHPVVATPSAATSTDPPSHSQSLPNDPLAVEASTALASPPPDKPVPPAYLNESTAFNALILGLDTTSGQTARTDVILLAHVIPAEKKVNLISVPRDTRVPLPGIGLTKINHAHFMAEMDGGKNAGTEAAIQAVSDLLQIPVHYYVKTNFSGFVTFIDTIGGIDVDIPKDMWLSMTRTPLEAGNRHLDGVTALAYVRERYSLEDGDFGRQTDHMKVMRAVVQKLLAPEKITELPGLLKQAKKELADTNLTDSDLISLAWLFKGMRGQDIKYMQIPGKSVVAADPLVRSPLWYWEPDKERLKELVRENLR
ncbi:LytR family transcriptional regulator [Paenibacillus elgii]|uniref:LytR family transcriptional regulator n=1 Tax=Paenibacillus elgii TaxID=189691 RepID=A0A163U332_9BACL|nr:LCP family protein [Paenibacillus elgii]KZE72747.1 LytR family transcriptional regulator [Paenibacillus elgii]